MDFALPERITGRLTDYGQGISCIDTGMIRPQLAASFLLEHDGAVAIIETGTAVCVENILELIRYKNIAFTDVLYVMPTHVHLDHAGAAGQLMQAFPNARLVIHPRGARHMAAPEQLWQGAMAVYGEQNMLRIYGELIPIAEQRMLIADDGYRLDFNGRPLLFLDTPGHARHHYSIYDEYSRSFFTGDTFGMAYRELNAGDRQYIMPTTSPVQFDPDSWSQTLDEYLRFQPEQMFVTHFGRVNKVAELTEDLRTRIQQYAEIAIQHKDKANRLQLIKQTLAEQTLAELTTFGCALPVAAIRGFLQMDFDVNAAGLDVWLSRAID